MATFAVGIASEMSPLGFDGSDKLDVMEDVKDRFYCSAVFIAHDDLGMVLSPAKPQGLKLRTPHCQPKMTE